MASIDNTVFTEVTTGALPDSLDVKLRKAPLSVIRYWAPIAGLAASGGDIGLWNDPVSDEDALVVAVLAAGTPNGLVRTTASDGKSVLWGEPSPRSWDEWSPVSQDLSIAAPTGVALDEFALGVGTEVELTTDDRIVPKVARPVIRINGAFQGVMPTADAQPKSTMYAEITETLTEFGGSPVSAGVVEQDVFYGSGGSTTILLPAVTVHAAEGSTFKVRCDLRLRYRDTVAEAFTVSINSLTVGLQVIEYTSL